MTRSTRTRLLWLLAAGMSASGCSFEAVADGSARVSNTCSSDADCLLDAHCDGTMCVARPAESSLRIVLDVAPLQSADGPAPVAISIPSFNVDEMPVQQWRLPRPLTVHGQVRNGESIVDADVTLTAASEGLGIPAKVFTAAVAGTAGALPDFDFEVRVPRDGTYTLRVQPRDTSLPPVERSVVIEKGDDIEVDYAELDLAEHTVELHLEGATDERPLVVRAFDLATGDLISSTAPVVGSNATLSFSTEPSDFRMVVQAEGAYDPDGFSDPNMCDHDTPVLPTFSIEVSASDMNKGKLELTLPAAPTRVSYEGWVELCEGSDSPAALPITLRSTAVTLDASSARWTAEVATDTEATPLESRYKFCVDVFPGDYTFVVTPPAGEPCEIFAERRTINPPDERGSIAKLVTAGQLSGTLETLDMEALAATTVDVQSLGREGVAQLHDDDSSLTAYNRSRQTTTDDNGEFSVLLDRGTYDIALKPPPGSGYAWNVQRDVTIASSNLPPNSIDMFAPIALDCAISYEDGGDDDTSTLAGAEVTAYGIITDELGVERAVAIGKAVADDAGRFMLLLPTEIGVGIWGEIP